MITADSITPIGTILKTHGVKGELNMTTSVPEVVEAGVCIVMDMEGIYVPFFIASGRSRSTASVLFTIDGYDTEDDVRGFVGKQVFMPDYLLTELIPEPDTVDDADDNVYLEDLIGMTLVDEDGNKVGKITDYDDSTANVVLSVIRDGNPTPVYVPFASDLFINIDFPNRTLQLEIPQGLLDL